MPETRDIQAEPREPGGPRWLDPLAAWCSRRERALLVAIVLGQILVLVAIATLHAAPLVCGQTVLLQALPVDPRDPFRGDYVILRYAFTDPTALNAAGLSGPTNSPAGHAWREDQPAYVVLTKRSDGHWDAGQPTPQRPAGQTYLAGRYARGRFVFGIEAFYVKQGVGRELEQAIRQGELWAEVAVAPWGQATLRGLRRK